MKPYAIVAVGFVGGLGGEGGGARMAVMYELGLRGYDISIII